MIPAGFSVQNPKRVLISAPPLRSPSAAVAPSGADDGDGPACGAMPRTLASRDGDTASPIPDAMMRSRDPSLGLAGARVGRSIATGAPSRLSEEVWCGLAARDAGGPESCAPSRCSTDCAGTRYTRSAGACVLPEFEC